MHFKTLILICTINKKVKKDKKERDKAPRLNGLLLFVDDVLIIIIALAMHLLYVDFNLRTLLLAVYYF